MSARELNMEAERREFEKAMNDARFFPAELDFARAKSPSGRDEYANSHLESCWVGWIAARRADLESHRPDTGSQTAPTAKPRLVPDIECKQGKCGFTTTGCWDVCSLRREYASYVIGAAVAPVVFSTGSHLDSEAERADEILCAARYQYIEDNATTHGGGKGFTITCFVPVDHEDMGCGIDAAIAATKPATEESPK